MPGLRKDQPGAGAVPRDPEGLGGPEPARDDRVREVRPAPAAEPAGRPLRARGRADRALHHGRRRGRGLDGARSASAPGRGPCHGGRAPARRRHDRSGAGERQDRHRPALDLRPRRWAVRRRRAAGRDLPLLARPAGRASAGASRGLRRHSAGGRLRRLQQALSRGPQARSDPGGGVLGACAAPVLRHGRRRGERAPQGCRKERDSALADRHRGGAPHRRAVCDRARRSTAGAPRSGWRSGAPKAGPWSTISRPTCASRRRSCRAGTTS